MSNRQLNASLCFLSAAALISQTLGAREVLAFSGGNEIVLGIVFGAWFFWSGVGAGLAGWLKLGQRARPSVLCLAATMGCGLLPLAQLLLLRAGAGWIETGDGRLTGVWQALGAAGLLLAPAPLVSGALFAALASAHAPSPNPLPQGEGADTVAVRFSWDALGAAAAGALFSLVLAGRFTGVAITLMVLVAGGAVAAALAVLELKPRRAVDILGGVCVALLPAGSACLIVLDMGTQALDRAMLAARPRFAAGEEKLLEARDSRYQQLLLTEYRGQYTVYGDGEALATYPNQEDTAAETHFTACQVPELRRVLVAGAGPGATVRELLRHKPERIDVVEFDSEVLALLRDKLSPEDRQALKDPAVRLHTGDVARFLFHSPAGEYDLIWLHPPAPSSIQTNRFYTVEFYERAARALSGRGVLTFSTVGAPNYAGRVMFIYLGTIRAALATAFPIVRQLPGSHERFLAAKQGSVLPATPDEAVARCRERGISVPSFEPEIFCTIWEPEHEARRAKDFDEPPYRSVPPNWSLHPTAMRCYFRLWDRLANAPAPDASASREAGSSGGLLSELNYWAGLIVVAVLLLVLLVIGILSARKSPRLLPVTAVILAGLGGASAIALVLALLGAYQAACGHVFERLAFISGLYMLGLALGNRLASALLRWRADVKNAVAAAQLGLFLSAGASLVLTGSRWDLLSPAVVEALVAALITAFAVAAGVQLPLLTTLASRRLEDSTTEPRVGLILAADFAGATIGALTAGSVLIPWHGVPMTILIIAACAFFGLVALWEVLSGTAPAPAR